MTPLEALNHRGGLALVKSTWASWLQYRSFFFLLAFGWMIPPLIYLFVWSTAAGEGQVGGLTRGGFVGYYLILILVNQITYAQTNWTVGDVIRGGGLNSWLLRPMPPLYNALSSELAGKVVYMVFVVPVAGVLALLLRPEVHPGPGGVPLAALAVALAWALRFFWGLWIALLAFWATRADALLAVQDSLVFLLAGVVAPVTLLPGLLQTAARFLPFRYMVGFPVEILTGQLSAGETLIGFAVQTAWLAVALALSAHVWTTGLRRYSAVGG
jgi:ABC-2 type transport system permease protein